MRISQKLDYACRASLQLAKSYDGKTVLKLDDLSEREQIPSSFLVQILTELRKAGIVVSKRGKAGGYLLAKEPASITFFELIQAIEPQLIEDAVGFDGESGFQIKGAWSNLSLAFEKASKQISLDSMQSNSDEPMWFI